YLRRGRPQGDRREVFLRARAPYGPMASGTVASTVRRACRRAGIAEVGSHRLRHTVACQMVAAGGPVLQVAPGLRDGSPARPAARLAVARGFARYLQTIDPATEVPPPGVFPARRHRPAPYLWSQEDICHLLEGARVLPSPLRAATHEALFGLLATTGMRLGEAIGLERDDVDLGAGVITVRQ